MRVTHVITRLIVGGAQENTIATLLGLQALPGVEADLISGIESGAEGSLASQINPADLHLMPELVRNLHPWKDVQAWRKLVQRFREKQPDIVHTHSGKAGILGRLAAKKAGVPVIIHTIHGPSFGPFQNFVANQLFKRAEQHAGKITTHFISVADAMSRQYLAAGIGKPGLYTTIFSGFDLEPYLNAKNDLGLREQFGIKPADIVVGMIARLFKLKGHDDLVRVAPSLVAKNPRLKFLLVGDGPERARLENQISEIGLKQHFIFTGLMPPAEISRYTGIMDLLVHLSRREGLPRALPQALAAARPVVAYDCDGASEVCFSGKTGFLVVPGDFRNLEKSILTLADDPEMRGRWGTTGREFVRERFSTAGMVKAIHALYLQVLGGRQRRD